MTSKLIGFTIKQEENFKLVSVPLDKKTSDFLDSKKQGRHHSEYIREFLITPANFKSANDTFIKGMKDSLPKDIRNDCKVCIGESTEESDRSCNRYYLQMEFTYNVVVVEFINIVLKNKHIYQDKQTIFELTKEFFKCIVFLAGKGIMVFDMERLKKYVLKIGLISLSQLLNDSKPLQRLAIINDSLDSLNQQDLENKIFGNADCDCITLQKQFFLNKQTYYKENLFIDRQKILFKEGKLPNSSNQNGHTRPNRTDIAYFCYYASETKELKTDNLFSTKKAWKEIGQRFDKDDTNIQKAYNKIYSNRSERLKSSKTANIEYVLEHMLTKYPKARKLALDELKLAKLN